MKVATYETHEEYSEDKQITQIFTKINSGKLIRLRTRDPSRYHSWYQFPDLSETRLEQIERLSGCYISFDERKGLSIKAHSGKHFWERYKPISDKKFNDQKTVRKFLYYNHQNKVITLRPELKNLSKNDRVIRCFRKYFQLKTITVPKMIKL